MILEIALPGEEADTVLNDMLGLRVVQRGETKSGRYPFVALENSELTALAVARSRQARVNREANKRARA